MSLFPAYSSLEKEDKLPEDAGPNAPDTSEWLENNSFPLRDDEIKNVHNHAMEIADDSDSNSLKEKEKSHKKDHKHKKKSKGKKHKRKDEEPPTVHVEFNGEEEYYVDKAPAHLYKTVRTLHKPACPRYRCHYQRKLGLHSWSALRGDTKDIKRYYRQNKNIVEPTTVALDENDYTLLLGQLNRKTMELPAELKFWLELIELQDRNPYKWSRLMLAEKKLDLVQRALVYHPRSEPLYRMYIDIISATYPAFEVNKMLDRLLSKDPYNYTIWTAQIMTTQGSMARCVVPDVLLIYERCMQKMHHAQKQSTAGDINAGSDEVMLKLFNNCALFLRQAGLNEQFFALIKLALELNVSTDQFGDFAPLDSDQRILIEYEEMILQSGLPMTEIWLRIERLRQGYNFLPCPANISTKCSDPQRIVFNEDVCHYIYPLKSRENSFYLMLLILRLLKVPFVHCDGLAAKFCARVEHIGDSDAIEDILASGIRRTYALPQKEHDEFMSGLYELSKEMAVSPTYLNNCIGHEIYAHCLTQLLLNCAAAYAGIDERKRIIFISMWCRFERLLLVLQKYSKKLTADYVKAGRSRFKALLKQPLNRNVLNFYTEFAIFEFEALSVSDSLQPIENIFENLIAANSADETLSSDLCNTYVSYAEILIGRGLHEHALQLLAAYAFAIDVKSKESIGTAKQLAALHQITQKLDSVVAIERNVDIMILEQYLLPDYTVSLLKLHALMQYLVGQKLEAMSHLEKLLKVFACNTDRHNFLREHIQELYITVMQLPNTNCAVSNALVSAKVFAALEEFPRNIFLLQRCGMVACVPWYKIRSAMLRSNPTILSVTFLIIAARYRFNCQLSAVDDAVSAWDHKHNEMVVRNRILNMFKSLTDEQQQKCSVLQRNALFWRFYLRCLSDQSTAFETSQKCLLTALDECPWNKALYLDGATYVPQELSHLQDLIIEKQLRIYALPEELEILREK